MARHRAERRADLVRQLRRQLAQRRQPLLVPQLLLRLAQQTVELRQRLVLARQVERSRFDLVGEPAVEGADLAVGLGQPGQHGVEAARQRAHLVAR